LLARGQGTPIESHAFMVRRFIPFAFDLWKHRELLLQFTLRNVELRHKGSHLGLAWSFLNPLLLLGLYVLVFGYIFEGKFGILPNETKTDYGLGIFLGLTIYHFTSEVLAVSSGIVISNPNFVKKVVFPLEILPAAHVGAAVVHLLISLSLVLLSMIVVGSGVNWGVLWLPVVILPVVMLFLGISWLISAFGVFFRDIGQLMQFLALTLMFASAIFYSAQKIPADMWVFMRLNPVLLAIELARDVALWTRPLNLQHLAYLYATGLCSCYVGYFTFKRLKPAFADVL
jgi:lipopolysaccharide transport system permease protein